jgi:hypothetical protein
MGGEGKKGDKDQINRETQSGGSREHGDRIEVEKSKVKSEKVGYPPTFLFLRNFPIPPSSFE